MTGNDKYLGAKVNRKINDGLSLNVVHWHHTRYIPID
jgi:hypothetical protein